MPHLVLSYESDANLADFFKRYPVMETDFVKRKLSAVSEDIVHIHEKGILHNKIITSDICVRYKSSHYDPVLVGFSSACRIDSSKVLTHKQQHEVNDYTHLPPRFG